MPFVDPDTVKSPVQRKIIDPDASQPQQEDEVKFEDLVKRVATSPHNLGPMGPLGGVLDVGNQEMARLISRGAYKAGGKITDITGSPEAGLATNIGIQAIPIALGSIGGGAAKKGLEKGAEALMQQAIKPPKEMLLKGTAQTAIKTMLGEGVNVTSGGVEKLRRLIDSVDEQISTVIKNNPSIIKKEEVTSYAIRSINKVRDSLTANADVKTITGKIDEFLNDPFIAKNLTMEAAQRIKRGAMRALREQYGEMKQAETEVQKDITHGLKEEIAKRAPEIKDLNKRLSGLLDAELMTMARVLMNGNKEKIGLKWIVTNPLHLIGWMAEQSPLVKSLLARSMYSASKGPTKKLGALGGATVDYAADQLMP